MEMEKSVPEVFGLVFEDLEPGFDEQAVSSGFTFVGAVEEFAQPEERVDWLIRSDECVRIRMRALRLALATFLSRHLRLRYDSKQ